MKKRFSEEQIIGFLREAQAGMPVKEYAGSTASTRPPTTCGTASSAGMSVPDAKRLKELETENARLGELTPPLMRSS